MSELTDLISAAADSPGKSGLVRAVLRAARDAVDPEEAAKWLAGVDPAPHDADTRVMAAAFLVDLDDAEAAIAWTAGAEPKLRLARAKALLAAGRIVEAVEDYKAAKTTDPSLADPELDKSLAVKQAATGGNVVDFRGRPVETAAVIPAGREKKTFADVGGLADSSASPAAACCSTGRPAVARR
jgi:hypothetical protein